LLEVLVHAELRIDEVPMNLRYLEIDFPDSVKQETVDASRLPEGWSSDLEATRQIGDAWLVSNRSALLFVPCVIVPETFNILVNPMHPDSQGIAVKRVHSGMFDTRLRKTRPR
jgi:RES domain-containing protein